MGISGVKNWKICRAKNRMRWGVYWGGISREGLDFSVEKNMNIIERCKFIENMILKKYKTKKTKSFVINNQLTKGYIMLSNCYPICKNNFILKISGIWETETEYGLSFKFININRQL